MEALAVVDDAVSGPELAFWQSRVQTGTQSTGLPEEAVSGTELYGLAQRHTRGLSLIHCLLFDIRKGHETELHRDVGEYVVLFYPFDNEGAPLRLCREGVLEEVAVKANRLVALNCTTIWHQQVAPKDDSSRYSVAFKFRLPEAHNVHP
jgi:hypothetical protein